MDEIALLRAKIDRIDQEILVLLKARSENARYIGQVKRSRGLLMRAPERERGILQGIERAASDLKLNVLQTRRLFRDILEMSVEGQLATNHRSRPSLQGLECLIVGGTGEMGRLFVHMLKSEGANIVVAGRSPRRTQRAAMQLGVGTGAVDDAARSDIVVVSVPVEATAAVSTRVASFMGDGALLTELSSVKNGIADRIASHTPRTVEYVSLHPLFGPEIDAIYGENLIVVPYRAGPLWKRLSNAFHSLGLRQSVTTADRHDRVMGFVQGLHHFALISLAMSLASWDGSYETHSLRSTIEKIKMLSENTATISAIQNLNKYSKRNRCAFRDEVDRLYQLNKGGFDRVLSKLSEHVQKW